MAHSAEVHMAGTILSLVLAIVTFTISICSWMEKGFLFNNAYIFASEEERKTMNKRPYYRQSAIVFCLLGILFLLIAVAALSGAGWLYTAAWAVALVAIVYAVASSVKEAVKGR